MKKILLVVCAALLIAQFSPAGKSAHAADSEPEDEARYRLYLMPVDNIDTPILLDSKTGKIWLYQRELTTGRVSFTGITVEGIAFSKKDASGIDSFINQWQLDGIVDKSTPGLSTKLLEEFSYNLDSAKAKVIGDEQKR